MLLLITDCNNHPKEKPKATTTKDTTIEPKKRLGRPQAGYHEGLPIISRKRQKENPRAEPNCEREKDTIGGPDYAKIDGISHVQNRRDLYWLASQYVGGRAKYQKKGLKSAGPWKNEHLLRDKD